MTEILTIYERIKELSKESNKLKKSPVYKQYQTELNKQGWYHLSQAARQTGTHRATIHKRVKAGKVTHFYLFNKLWVKI